MISSFIAPVDPMTAHDELVQAFAALANPHRLEIYQRLMAQTSAAFECCLLQDLIARLDIGAPTISHHIKILEQAKLIRVERTGKYLRCALNEDMRERLRLFF
jgi:DNA-binding transcriptional ArsR family regulator